MYKIFVCENGIVIQNEEYPAAILKVDKGSLEHSENVVTVYVKEETKGVLGGVNSFSGRTVNKPKVKIINSPVLVTYDERSIEEVEGDLYDEVSTQDQYHHDISVLSSPDLSINPQVEEALNRVLAKLENATIFIQPEVKKTGPGRPSTRSQEETPVTASESTTENNGPSEGNQG